MVKKAYIKTLEVMIAIIVTAMFVVLLVPMRDISTQKEEKFFIMDALSKDSDFRINVVTTTKGCYNSTSLNDLTQKVEEYLLEDYTYFICLDEKKTELPEKKIFLETSFITGNMTNYTQRVVRLYYWLP